MLIVLDQFEQWLHDHRTDRDSELLRALRPVTAAVCSSWFWFATTSGWPLPGSCTRSKSRLSKARTPPPSSSWTRPTRAHLGGLWPRLREDPRPARGTGSEAVRFLDEAARELAGPDRRIIPIRLTLFAETVRHRPWRPETLRALGGIDGIGVTFLEETFGERSAPLAHRSHRRATMAVLKGLLPDPPSDLRGAHPSRRVLQEAAGYADRDREFDELLSILDNELRMVTPVDAEKLPDEPPGPPAEDGEKCYQLTHDYLVGPLRRWLTRKQKETRTGRAELRLAERTALWTNKPERKQLPNWWEWLRIRSFTSRARWTAPERKMMTSALWHHLRNMVILASIASIFAVLLAILKLNIDKQLSQTQVQEQVRQLWSVDLRYLPQLLDRLDGRPELWRDQVGQHLGQPGITPDQRTRGLLAWPGANTAGLDYLAERLLVGELDELRGAPRRATALEGSDRTRFVPRSWNFEPPASVTSRRRPPLPTMIPGVPSGTRSRPDRPGADRPGSARSELVGRGAPPGPRSSKVTSPGVLRRFLGWSGPEAVGCGILAEYAKADDRYLSGEVFARLMLDANPEQFSILYPIASRRRPDLAERMTAALGVVVPLTPSADHAAPPRRSPGERGTDSAPTGHGRTRLAAAEADRGPAAAHANHRPHRLGRPRLGNLVQAAGGGGRRLDPAGNSPGPRRVRFDPRRA